MTESDSESVAICVLLLGYGVALQSKKKEKRKLRRRVWVKEWISERERLGAYNALVNNFSLSE